jgi:hypothetical protein
LTALGVPQIEKLPQQRVVDLERIAALRQQHFSIIWSVPPDVPAKFLLPRQWPPHALPLPQAVVMIAPTLSMAMDFRLSDQHSAFQERLIIAHRFLGR